MNVFQYTIFYELAGFTIIYCVLLYVNYVTDKLIKQYSEKIKHSDLLVTCSSP